MKPAIHDSILIVSCGSAMVLAIAISSAQTNQDTKTERAAPKTDTKTLTLRLTVSKDEKPLSAKYASFELKNTGDKPIEFKSYFPSGIYVFIDNEVLDSTGKRISEKFYREKVSSPFSEAHSVATIDAGKSLKKEFSDLFVGIPTENLKPGKYKCRLRFSDKAEDYVFEASSEQIEVELTQDDIDKRGPSVRPKGS
jgi:hypothetical protein